MRTDGYDFVARYKEAADGDAHEARAEIEGMPGVDDETRQAQLASFENSAKRFGAVFDKASWEQDVSEGSRRFSYEAFMAALFIYLYREEPVLQVPFRILEMLIDIDETLTLWRQRHTLMAHRMLGRLVGTAGSGYAYLDETAKRTRPSRTSSTCPPTSSRVSRSRRCPSRPRRRPRRPDLVVGSRAPLRLAPAAGERP